MIGKTMTLNELLNDYKEDIKRSFLMLCMGMVLWTASISFTGISSGVVAKTLFLLLSEFMRIVTLVSGLELCAPMTEQYETKQRPICLISSVLYYIGIAALAIRAVCDGMALGTGMFGSFLLLNNPVSVLAYFVFNIIIVFLYGAYSYMFYYSCNNKREKFISKQCVAMVIMLAICFCTEAVVFLFVGQYVPSMFVAGLFIIYSMKNVVEYKRSIEYHEEDYYNVLSPSHTKPAFVCDDEGRILFENTRAFVMRQTYKDKFIGRFLTDVFEITDYDKARLSDPKNTKPFEVYCTYKKEPNEMVLLVHHNIDKYGAIFSTEIEIGYAADFGTGSYTPTDKSTRDPDAYNTRIVLTDDELSDFRTKELIKMIEYQSKAYAEGKKEFFKFNLKGIRKAAQVLNLAALDELCGRINRELTFGEWKSLEPLLIELDRQYETLKFIVS